MNQPSNEKQQTNGSGSMLSPLGSGGPATAARPTGGLSALSTLTDLLDRASTFTTPSRQNDEGTGVGSRQQQNRQRFDYSRGRGNDEGKTNTGNRFSGGSRWKGSAGFVAGDFTGGRRQGGNIGSPDSFAKGFQQLQQMPRQQQSSAQETSSDVMTASRPSSDTTTSYVARSALSTPGSTTVYAAESPLAESSNTPPKQSDGFTTEQQSKTALASSTESQAANKASSASSATASQIWRPRRPADPRDLLRREVNSLLNKLTIENFPTVGERLCVIVESCTTEEQLSDIVSLVLDKAFNEPEFSELYSDLCLVMSYRAPSLTTSNDKVANSQKPPHQALFSSLLFLKWKDEFNRLPVSLELTQEQKETLSLEDQEVATLKMKTRVKGLCVSFSEFVVRRMIGMRGFNTAVSVILSAVAPAEHLVEGVCQMLTTAGSSLDNDSVGRTLLDNCFGRLHELQINGLLSNRIECLVQDLIDARQVNWHKKVHKEKAKGLAQIKKEVENAELVGGSTVLAQHGIIVQLGERSNLLHNRDYATYIESQEERHHLRIQRTSTT